MSVPQYHVLLEFGVGGPRMIVRDKEVIRRLGPLHRGLLSNQATENWETDGIAASDVPFQCTRATQETAQFVLNHIASYVAPEQRGEESTREKYPEANQLSIEQLVDVLRLGEYFEAESFLECISFVIGQKTRSWSWQQVAELLALPTERFHTPDRSQPEIEQFHLSADPDNAPGSQPRPGEANDENGAAANGNGNGAIDEEQ